jgi:hypothetical protein
MPDIRTGAFIMYLFVIVGCRSGALIACENARIPVAVKSSYLTVHLVQEFGHLFGWVDDAA